MFSVMTLPAELLAQLPPSVVPGGVAGALARAVGADFGQAAAGLQAAGLQAASSQALRLGLPLDALLPDGGLPRGAVVEMAISGAAALGTSVALAACQAAQRSQLFAGSPAAWCAFVDPTGSLYAPAAVQAGVSLERLLVLRPSAEALSRTALRLVESQVFPLVVIDLAGVPGKPLDIALAGWARVVRRLAIAVEQTESSVLLITDAAAARPLPLPVAQRFELSLHADLLSVRIAKDRRGRVMGPRKVRASAMRSAAAANAACAHTNTELGHAQQQLSA